MKLALYGYFRSSSSWRVRIALGLKGLAYEHRGVHLLKDGGEQKLPAHLARNPAAQVPVLAIEREGHAPTYLAQSLAILEWLEEAYPSPRLLPDDPLLRAHARRLAETVNSGIQPFQNLATLNAVKALGGDANAWAAKFIAEGLVALEALTVASAGTFSVGDSPSVADCCLVPQLYGARRFGVDLAPFPTLLRVEAACAKLPAFAAAHPDVQPDAPAPEPTKPA